MAYLPNFFAYVRREYTLSENTMILSFLLQRQVCAFVCPLPTYILYIAGIAAGSGPCTTYLSWYLIRN